MNEMNAVINPELIGKNRAILESWNLIGKKIFVVRREPADLMFNDRKRDGDPTLTMKPIMKYIIEGTNIFGVRLVPLPDKTTLVIELNNNPTLQFKIGPAKFREVTMETITEAVENNEKNSSLGREPILFDDLISLTEQVNKLNALEKAKAEAIAEDMLNQAKLLSDLNDIHLTECDKYYTELGTPITK